MSPESRTVAGLLLAATAASAHAESFTVIGLPDTQFYSESYPEIFLAQTEWVVAERTALDIRFVSHFGDLVQHGNDLGEWANAVAAMDVIRASGLPYGVTAGNHDITPVGGDASGYIPQFFFDRFGPPHWDGVPWVVSVSPSGMSNAQRFNAAGVEWLWLHIECDLAIGEMAWAQGVLDHHRDLPAVITTHRWLQDAEDYTGGVPVVPSGWYPPIWYTIEDVHAPNGVQTEEAWRWFVRINPSVFLMNCGHFHEEYRQTNLNVDGLPVHQVLADYQDDPNGGDGWLRIMTFDVGNDQILFESYSPTLDAVRTADESLFTLPVDFDAYRLAPSERFTAFQESINAYGGTVDTWINEAAPNTAYGESSIRESDDDIENSIFTDDQAQSLIRFESVFTEDGAGHTVPYGSTILEATLTIELDDDIDHPIFSPDFYVYEVIVPWTESSTWNSMNGGLTVGQDLGALVAVFSGDNDPDSDSMRRLDITGLAQAWANGQANHGIAILPEIISGNDDGISILTSESGNPVRRPRLEIRYASATVPCPADVDGDGTVGFNDVLPLLATWGPCAACAADVNHDGAVDFDDLLTILTAWGACP